MQNVVGIRFKKAGKIYYFTPGELELSLNDHVIVETARGMEYGTVVIPPRNVEDSEVVSPLKVVRRKANVADDAKVEDNHRRQEEAYRICEQKIAEHKLPMKLIEVEYTFDVNKIIFYFTADGRIDFRELVKDLASIFRTRIELRQIGVRDEAKFMGGIGCCGRPLCCATFLGDFEPVSIRMAKEQNLSLNPTKISGICGRLMCCLKYESNCYCGEGCPNKRKKVEAPERGSRVICEDGEGKVIAINPQRRTATILLDDGNTTITSWEEVIVQEAPEGGEPVPETNDVESSQKDGGERHGRRRHESGKEGSHEGNRQQENRGERGERRRRPRKNGKPGNAPREENTQGQSNDE